ncbi:MAG: SDR family oxidoreductase [Gemmatimonadota bacterium]
MSTTTPSTHLRRTVLITGAGGALGTHVSHAFEAAGWRLALAAHTSQQRERLQGEHAGAAVGVVDLGDEDAARTAIAELVGNAGGVDGLVNLVGGFAMSDARSSTLDQLRHMLAVNLEAPYNAIRATLPHLTPGRNGFIIGIGAAPGLDGAAGMGPYAASKGALIAYLRSLRLELAREGIRVSLVHPLGAFDTPGNRAAMPDVDPALWIDPADMAASILHLAERSGRGAIDELRVLTPPPPLST